MLASAMLGVMVQHDEIFLIEMKPFATVSVELLFSLRPFV